MIFRVRASGQAHQPKFSRNRRTLPSFPSPKRTCKAQVSTAESAISYVRQLRILREGDTLEACELSSGSINFVFRLSDSSTSLLLKYCPPYVKSLGEGTFPLTQERLAVEAAAMELLHAACPRHVPRLLHYDAQSCVLIQQYLHSHQQLSAAIHEHGLVFPRMAYQLGDFVSRSLYLNSRYTTGEAHMSAMVTQFRNAEVVAANERVVLTDAFDRDCPANRCAPELAGMMEELRSDLQVQAAHAYLLEVYRARKEALIHNDLHLGNILVGVEQLPSSSTAPPEERAPAPEAVGQAAGCEVHTDTLPGAGAWAPSGSLFVIDYEFATVGPMAFDLGSLLGNLLLAYLTVRAGCPAHNQQSQGAIQDPTAGATPSRLQQQRWLLACIHDFWEQLPANFERAKAGGLVQGLHTEDGGSPLRQGLDGAGLDVGLLLHEAAGFAALCMVRLTVGMHRYHGHASLTPQQRVQCGAWTLQLARELLRRPRSCDSDPQRSRLDAQGLVQLLEGVVAS